MSHSIYVTAHSTDAYAPVLALFLAPDHKPCFT